MGISYNTENEVRCPPPMGGTVHGPDGGVLGSCGPPAPGGSPMSGVWRGPFPSLAQAVISRQTWFLRPRPSGWDRTGAHLSAGKLGAVWGTRVDHGHWGASLLQQEAVGSAWRGAREEAGRGGCGASVTPSSFSPPRIIDQRFEKASYFVFGDFNFRLDSKSVVEVGHAGSRTRVRSCWENSGSPWSSTGAFPPSCSLVLFKAETPNGERFTVKRGLLWEPLRTSSWVAVGCQPSAHVLSLEVLLLTVGRGKRRKLPVRRQPLVSRTRRFPPTVGISWVPSGPWVTLP